MMKNRIQITFGIMMLCIVGCRQTESLGTPFSVNPSIPEKNVLTNNFPVEAILYVDTATENPLNAQDYIFTGNSQVPNTQFFNYVVLGYSYLTKDSAGFTHLELTPSLKYVLDNSISYIRPLHKKGLKVLIEVRSGRYDDHEDGIQAGLAVMDVTAINAFITELEVIIQHYGIDGFDFNDIGGGRNSYPPFTGNLKRITTGAPFYPVETLAAKLKALLGDSIFLPADLSFDTLYDLYPEAIEDILWIEGGSNFAHFIQRINELLKEKYKDPDIPDTPDNPAKEIIRNIFVRTQNHGNKLVSKIRAEYLPDAYSGASTTTTANLNYIVNDVAYDNTKPHTALWSEDTKSDVGNSVDNQYIPFAIDLGTRLSDTDARLYANTFLYKNPADLTDPNKYGALYFTNLKPISESEFDLIAYMTLFSRAIFGRPIVLSGSGDYKKTW